MEINYFEDEKLINERVEKYKALGKLLNNFE